MNNSTSINTYWKFYGLESEPFAVEKQTIYLPPRWEQLFDLLNHHCHESNAIISLTAPTGAGKTTFIEQYVTHCGDAMQICQLSATSNLTVYQMLSAMSQSFSLSVTKSENLEDQLDAYLGQIQHCKRLCLLIIDNAENLSATNLQSLLYLVRHQSDTQMRLHIILVGHSELQDKLQQLTEAEGEAELVNAIEFTAFSLSETGAYLRFCLQHAGLPAASPFSPRAINKIYKLTAGLPKEINWAAPEALIELMQSQRIKKLIDYLQFYKTQIIGGFIFAPILIFGLFMFAKHSHYQKSVPIQTVSQTKPLKMPETKSKLSSSAKNEQHKVVIPAKILATNIKPAIVIKTPIKPLPTVPPKVAQQHPSQSSVNKVATVTPPKNSPPIVKPSAPITLVQKSKSPAALAVQPQSSLAVAKPAVQVAVSKNIADKEKPVVQVAHSQTSSAAAKPTVQAAVSKNISDKEKPIAQVAHPQNSLYKAKPGILEAHLKNSLYKTNPEVRTAGPQNGYTIQLIGLSNENSMRLFITKNSLERAAVFYRSKLNNKDWFVVLYGQYATPEAAKAAIAKLPATVQAQKPWVRKLANVQYSIQKIA